MFVEAVPPTCSAQAVRIKLAARKLAELAGHIEAVQWQDRAGRLKLACLLARGLSADKASGQLFDGRTVNVSTSWLALSVQMKLENMASVWADRQAPTQGFVSGVDGLLDLCMQHVVTGKGLGERPCQRKENVCV